ncbi:hypothetical protein JJ691_00760 [Kutzneria sp. CA-103260]|nr:hypothetical protein JJ691_00760 [Kutzneria sp. CA-103260]
MTKQLRVGWMNIGVGAILIVGWIAAFVSGTESTDQLVFQGILLLCGIAMVVQGISWVVKGRRD